MFLFKDKGKESKKSKMTLTAASSSASSTSTSHPLVFKNKEEAQEALFEAARKGDIAAIDQAIQAGANVQAKDNNGDTALLLAAMNGQTATIDHLVSRYGADVQAKDNNGNNALHLAANYGHTATIDHLVSRYHLDVQTKNNGGTTALHCAAYNSHTACIDALVRHGADVHTKNNDGKTPAMWAKEHGRTAAAVKLEAYEKQRMAATHSSSVTDSATSLSFYSPYRISGSSSSTSQPSWGLRPSYVTFKKYSNDAEAALFEASEKGDTAAIAQAIQAGASVNAKCRGHTALEVAARCGHAAAIEALINHGADVHAKDSYGNTALHAAARYGHTAAIDALVRRGADPHIKTPYNETLLILAANEGRAAAVEHLLSRYSLDVEAKDLGGKTALHRASAAGHIAVIDILVRHGADVKAKSDSGKSALHEAAGSKEVVAALVRHGADVHAKDGYGETALHKAARYGETAVIDMLVHYGANVNAKGNYGETALHQAAQYGQTATIDHLVSYYGADVHAKNKDGKTPALLAKEQGKTEAAAKLEAYEKQYPPGPRPSQAATMLSSAAKPSAAPISLPIAQPALYVSPASSATVAATVPTARPALPSKPLPAAPKVLPKAPVGQASARYPYTASDAMELTLVQGQLVSVIEKQASGWWLCELNGKRGLVPSNYLQEDVASSISLPSTSAQAPASTLPAITPVVIRPSVTPPHAISTPSHPSFAASSSSSTHGSSESEALSLTDTKDFDQWVIPYSDLTLGKRLGRGSFGEVHLATYVHEPVAVKTLFVGETEKALEDFKREVTVMMHLKSMYIVLLRAVTIKPYSIVMEYLPKGSLTQLLRNPNESMPWSQRHQLASDIAKGLAFLHHHHVLHRDLKSDNVLLTDTYQAKLSDFGLSKIKVASSQYMSLEGSVGTLCWMAPEVMDDENKSPYRAASDVYSYAMVVWELMTRREPYEGLSAKQLFVKVVIKAQREVIPGDAPLILQAITIKGWAQAPEERPSADEIVKHLDAHPIAPSAEPPVPMGLASNTASVYGQRLGSALGVSDVGLASNTASLAPGAAASASSTAAGSSQSGPGFWNNLASLPPASRASVSPVLPKR